MPEPFFSVIVPTIGPAPHLLETLDSVMTQRHGVEILLQVNPSSAVVSLPRVDPIRIAFNPRDLGCYGSVNAALLRARGEFVHVLHDDDFVLPGFYATMRRVCEALPDSFGAASCLYGNAEGDRVGYPPWQFDHGLVGLPIGDWLARQLPHGNPLQVPAVVIRRGAFDAVGDFRTDMPYCGDWEFYARLLTKFDWWYEPQDLARYRVHPGQRAHAMLADGRADRDVAEARRLAAGYLRQREAVAT